VCPGREKQDPQRGTGRILQSQYAEYARGDELDSLQVFRPRQMYFTYTRHHFWWCFGFGFWTDLVGQGQQMIVHVQRQRGRGVVLGRVIQKALLTRGDLPSWPCCGESTINIHLGSTEILTDRLQAVRFPQQEASPSPRGTESEQIREGNEVATAKATREKRRAIGRRGYLISANHMQPLQAKSSGLRRG